MAPKQGGHESVDHAQTTSTQHADAKPQRRLRGLQYDKVWEDVDRSLQSGKVPLLHRAAAFADAGHIASLLQLGFNANARWWRGPRGTHLRHNAGGESPLHLAVRANAMVPLYGPQQSVHTAEAITALIRYGNADPAQTVPRTGEASLHIARSSAAVHSIMRNACDRGVRVAADECDLHCTLGRALLSQTTAAGVTPVGSAAYRDEINVLTALLVWHRALRVPVDGDDNAVRGAYSPLQLAAHGGSVAAVRGLRAQGVGGEADARGINGTTALHLAAARAGRCLSEVTNGDEGLLVQTLVLVCGAHANVVDKGNRTPLHHLLSALKRTIHDSKVSDTATEHCVSRVCNVASFLIRHGALPHLRDEASVRCERQSHRSPNTHQRRSNSRDYHRQISASQFFRM